MAAWSLIAPAVWLATAALDADRLRAAALAGARSWAHWWPPPADIEVARTFVLLAPATLPGGLGLAAGLWAWRNYAITTGLGGITASAPITFDRRQWKRQVRTAKGLTDAPGAVPLLARGSTIPVGGTIRAVGHRWHPVFTLPATALARYMVIVGATGSGKTNLMIRLWAGWFTATLDACWAGKGNRPRRTPSCAAGGAGRRPAPTWPGRPGPAAAATSSPACSTPPVRNRRLRSRSRWSSARSRWPRWRAWWPASRPGSAAATRSAC